MARTKNPRVPQTNASLPAKDPWDVEHERSLQKYGSTATTDLIYPDVVHRGFESHFTAQELVRRYPIFEEAEEHRKFLVRNRSERLLIAGEKDNYFTPEELWEEDDRVHSKRQFSSAGEACWADEEGEEEELVTETVVESRVAVRKETLAPLAPKPKGMVGEDELEDDEQLAKLMSDPMEAASIAEDATGRSPPKDGPSAASNEITMDDAALEAELFGPPETTVTSPEKPIGPAEDHEPAPEPESAPEPAQEPAPEPEPEPELEPEPEFELPITHQADDHVTTITGDLQDIDNMLASLDYSSTATLTAITTTFVDGTLVVALCGHVKALFSESSAERLAPTADVKGDTHKQPIELDSDAANKPVASSEEDAPEEDEPECPTEWNLVFTYPHRPTVAFLNGPRNSLALIGTAIWESGTTLATILNYSDSRIVAVLAGRQHGRRVPSSLRETDYAALFENFFLAVQNSTTHEELFPAQHAPLASLLRTAQQDLVTVELLDDIIMKDYASSGEEESDDSSSTEPGTAVAINDDLPNADDDDSSPNTAPIPSPEPYIPPPQGTMSNSDYIRHLRKLIASAELTKRRLLFAQLLETQLGSMSHSHARMLKLLQQPAINFEAVTTLVEETHQSDFEARYAAALPVQALPVQATAATKKARKPTRSASKKKATQTPAASASKPEPTTQSSKRPIAGSKRRRSPSPSPAASHTPTLSPSPSPNDNPSSDSDFKTKSKSAPKSKSNPNPTPSTNPSNPPQQKKRKTASASTGRPRGRPKGSKSKAKADSSISKL